MLIKNMNLQQLKEEFKNVYENLDNKGLTIDERFLLERRYSRIERKLRKEYNINISDLL